MTPQYYAWEFRRFSELMCNVTPDIEMIACVCGAKWDDYPEHIGKLAIDEWGCWYRPHPYGNSKAISWMRL